MDRSLVNPYVKKIHDLPELILGRDDSFSDEDVAILHARMKKFPETIIELGSGSGKHIVVRATQTPVTLFLGFELRFKRVFKTAEKAVQSNLTNVLLLKTKAEESLRLFEPASLAGIYCNFPDPWEKKHWQKHRMLREEILTPLLKTLKPDGFFAFKTDHREYFYNVRDQLAANELMKIEICTEDLKNSPAISTNVETEFECLFRSKGLPTYFVRATKKR